MSIQNITKAIDQSISLAAEVSNVEKGKYYKDRSGCRKYTFDKYNYFMIKAMIQEVLCMHSERLGFDKVNFYIEDSCILRDVTNKDTIDEAFFSKNSLIVRRKDNKKKDIYSPDNIFTFEINDNIYEISADKLCLTIGERSYCSNEDLEVNILIEAYETDLEVYLLHSLDSRTIERILSEYDKIKHNLPHNEAIHSVAYSINNSNTSTQEFKEILELCTYIIENF